MAANKAKAMSKSETFKTIAEATKLSRKQVAAVFDELTKIIKRELNKKPGEFSVPGLVKLRVQRKPATKETVRPDPFHPGQMMKVKAKPARNVVRARPLKGLKEMVK